MSPGITLIRHGQAGSRAVYDELSPLGLSQAGALGDWFARKGEVFDLVISGALNRQQQTVREIAARTGHGEIEIDPRWNEFDLDAVYAGIAPRLAEDDPDFRREFEELQRDMVDPDHAVHRAWRNCDTTVVRAWIMGKYKFEGEAFPEFMNRVASAFASLPQDRSVAVVTSATPIGLCCGQVLELAPRKIMHMAAAVFNTGFTVFTGGRLSSFNNTPHLAQHERTFR